jgi:undecaprenyl-diphosphatase
MNAVIRHVDRFDRFTFIWLHGSDGISRHRAIRWISHTGDGLLYVLAALTVLLVDAARGQHFFTLVAAGFALERALYWVLKNSIRRDRPAVGLQSFRAAITPSDQFSFPSGHTAAGFLFATLVLHCYPPLAPLCYVWASLVGMSRVLLGVHYPTDILAGATLGTGSALGVLAMLPTLPGLTG